MLSCSWRGTAWRTAWPAAARRLSSAGTKGRDGMRQQLLQDKLQKVSAARDEAEGYKERMDEARKAAIARGSRLAEAIDFDAVTGGTPPPWVAPPPPVGIEFLVEAQIEQSISRGVLANLEGKGKPIARDPHTDSCFGGDSGQAALNRMLKTAGFRPPSVEAREEMQRARSRLNEELNRAVAHRPVTASEFINCPRGTVARLAHAEYHSAVKAYNSAVLADREQFGSAWPLHNAAAKTLEEAVSAALDGETAKSHTQS